MASSKRLTEMIESDEQTLQLMVFIVAGGHFGINVAKVSEIMKYSQYPITPMPNSNPFVEGIFRPRTETMTVINLAAYMGLPPAEDEERDILIITKLNNVETAFHVHGVVAIESVRMSEIEKPDTTIYGGEEGLATGIAKHTNKLITIVDFEKILIDISPNLGFSPSDIDKLGMRSRSTKPILVAEDSPLLESLIISSLEKAGFVNILCASNGQEAWQQLTDFKDTGRPIESNVCAVITDIEMPLMDGHRLLRLIKEDEFLQKVPVFIFSSLVTEDNREIGKNLGATASISKPEIASLVELLDKHML
ncbi:MAG: chemotaxis protein [Defluviitaleaceae bacterium]|nr:chemotaxis protein [Defluviitaleaceae bacterium]MCL2263723.1 chemotaxis protein [Defluviitaleaceae bacterium]